MSPEFSAAMGGVFAGVLIVVVGFAVMVWAATKGDKGDKSIGIHEYVRDSDRKVIGVRKVKVPIVEHETADADRADLLRAFDAANKRYQMEARLERAERTLYRYGFKDLPCNPNGNEWTSPVSRATLTEFIDKSCLDDSRLVACAENAFYAFHSKHIAPYLSDKNV